MNDEVAEYKLFIDGLVKLRHCVLAQRVREGVWNSEPPPDQVKYNKLLSDLTPEQRDLIAEIIQSTRDGGIHDVLVFMTDKKYRLWKGNIQLALEPFGTEMYFDFIARRDGRQWPDERNT